MRVVTILLLLDFILLGIVIFAYVTQVVRDRKKLAGQASKSIAMQQKMYQVKVLQEINERIGYSMEGSKVVEIITNSIGNLLEYETVSYMLYSDAKQIIFKTHVHNPVNHRFIEQVQAKMLSATAVICGRHSIDAKIDRRLGGSILDDNLDVDVKSFLNIPIVINNDLLGLINIASSKPGLYDRNEAEVLYTITNQAAVAVSQLQSLLDNEKGKLLNIIASMTDGVMMVDLENQLEVYNPAVVDLLQLPVGKPVTIFDVMNSLAGKVDLRTKIEESLSNGLPLEVKDVYLHDRALEITISPVRDQKGEHRGAAIILHDVTSTKSLDKLRQEFTAMMVHELRAPLTAVRWSSEGLLKNLEGAKAHLEAAKLKDSITNIDLAATNMLDLVNDLLDVAKIEAGKFDLNIQEYDLADIIKNAITTFTPEAQAKHLPLNFISPGSIKVNCDQVRIAQVLNNLISNAIKYTDSGQIDINLIKDGSKNRVIVEVKDTGIGVSREDLAVLFSKFKQLQGYDRSRKGTGLGLVVSKGIIEAHGGKIWAESAGENLGSAFSFSLPLRGQIPSQET